jgi:hypothetical protein
MVVPGRARKATRPGLFGETVGNGLVGNFDIIKVDFATGRFQTQGAKMVAGYGTNLSGGNIMAMLETNNPKDLHEKAEELTSSFLSNMGYLPAPLVMLSASPDLLESLCYTLNRYRPHPRLSMEVLASIRYLVAVDEELESCEEFNRDNLTWMGMTEEELAAMRDDPRKAPMEPRDQSLLAFVMGALRNPGNVDPAALEELRAQGFTDADVLDASFHGADLIGKARLVKAFRVESFRAPAGE